MPIRTSIVTGKKDEQQNFWRFTVPDGVLVFDGKVKNIGRGGYIEKDHSMIKKLPKLKGKISHFLKVRNFEIDESSFPN